MPQGLKSLRIILLAALVAVNASVIILLGFTLNELKNQREREVRTTIENLARLLDQNLAASVSNIDLTLREIAESLERDLRVHGKLDAAEVNAALESRRGWLSGLAEFRVSNDQGMFEYGKARISVADRPFFVAHKNRSDSGLIVTNPILGRVANVWLISFTRRYTYPDGRFAGIVSAAIPVSHFAQMLAKLDLGPQGIALLRDSDTALITRFPPIAHPAQQPGTKVFSKELADIIASGVVAATYHTEKTGEGTERTNTYRRLSSVPFHLVAGMGADDYLADWRSNVKKAALMAAIFLLLSSAVAWLLWRSFRSTAKASERSRLLLQRASDGIHILDHAGNVIEASDSFCAMLGYPRAEVIGMNMARWDASFVLDDFRQMLARQFKQRAMSMFETRHRRQDDSLIEVEVTGYPLQLDGQLVLFCSARDITARKQAEAELKYHRDHLESLVEERTAELFQASENMRLFIKHAPISIAMFDLDMTYLVASDRWLADFVPGDGNLSGRRYADVHPDAPEQWQEICRQGLSGATVKNDEDLVRHRDGRTYWLRWAVLPWTEPSGKNGGFIVFAEDITERKRAEELLRIAATAFESQQGMIVADADTTILRVNRAFTEITGYTADDVVGQPTKVLKSGRHDEEFYAALWTKLSQNGAWQGEIWNRRKNGEVFPEWLTITAVTGDSGAVTHYVAALSDITQRKAAEEEIKRLAFYDPLTQLPNRRLLQDRLRQSLAAGARSGRPGALLFIDLDNFKTLNDTLGHQIGDLLLQQVAQRLSTCIRESDTVARLGGDEFVVILNDLSELRHEAVAQTEAVGQKIIATLAQPYLLEGNRHRSTPSIGATLFNGQTDSVDDLLKQADLAMYQAKAAGRNTLRFFAPAMQAAVVSRAALEADLCRDTPQASTA